MSLLRVVFHYVAQNGITFVAILLPQLLEQVEITDRSHQVPMRLTC